MVKDRVSKNDSRINFQLLIKLCEKGYFGKKQIEYLLPTTSFVLFESSASEQIMYSFDNLLLTGDDIFKKEKEQFQMALVNLECIDWLESERSKNYILISLWEEYAAISPLDDNFYNLAFMKIIESRCWGNVDTNLIVNFIDYCALRHGRESVSDFINLKSSQWHQRVCRVLHSLWLDSDKVIKAKNDEYDWILKRLHDEKFFSVMPFFENNKLKSAYLFCYLDLWVSKRESHEVDLFFIKLKKSWSQKKFRDGVKGKKVLNTYISSESKSKLEEMANLKGMRLNQVLEEIIDSSYGNWSLSKG